MYRDSSTWSSGCRSPTGWLRRDARSRPVPVSVRWTAAINRIPCSQVGADAETRSVERAAAAEPDVEGPPQDQLGGDSCVGFCIGGAATIARVLTPFTRGRESIPRLDRTGRRVPKTCKRIAKRRSGTRQAGGTWSVKPGNGGPPDDQVKCFGPGSRRVRGTPTPASRTPTTGPASWGRTFSIVEQLQESGLGVARRDRGESHAGIDGRMAGQTQRARITSRWMGQGRGSGELTLQQPSSLRTQIQTRLLLLRQRQAE